MRQKSQPFAALNYIRATSDDLADPTKVLVPVDLVDEEVSRAATLAQIAGGGSSGSGVINVKDYGAVGDGSTDDTDAIQAAIDVAVTGGTVYMPHGYYRITSTIVIDPNSNKTFRFYGPGIITQGNGQNLQVLVTATTHTNLETPLEISVDGNKLNNAAVTGIFITEQYSSETHRYRAVNCSIGAHIFGNCEKSTFVCEMVDNDLGLFVESDSVNVKSPDEILVFLTGYLNKIDFKASSTNDGFITSSAQTGTLVIHTEQAEQSNVVLEGWCAWTVGGYCRGSGNQGNTDVIYLDGRSGNLPSIMLDNYSFQGANKTTTGLVGIRADNGGRISGTVVMSNLAEGVIIDTLVNPSSFVLKTVNILNTALQLGTGSVECENLVIANGSSIESDATAVSITKGRGLLIDMTAGCRGDLAVDGSVVFSELIVSANDLNTNRFTWSSLPDTGILRIHGPYTYSSFLSSGLLDSAVQGMVIESLVNAGVNYGTLTRVTGNAWAGKGLDILRETLTGSSSSVNLFFGLHRIDSSSGAVNLGLTGGRYMGETHTFVMSNASNASALTILLHVDGNGKVFTFSSVDASLVLMWANGSWMTKSETPGL